MEDASYEFLFFSRTDGCKGSGCKIIFISNTMYVVLCLLWILVGADKLCGTSPVIPFTGYRIVRQYKLSLSGFKPHSQQFLTFVHCYRGKVDYQTTTKVSSINQIDWENPLCLYIPKLGSYLPDLPNDTVGRLAGKNVTEIEPSTISKLQKLTKYLQRKKDHLLQKLFNSQIIQYTGKEKSDHIKDIEGATLQASLEWESRNLVCYKLARRKKYAKRNFSFYIPDTFIGGIFQCNLTPEQKATVFKDFKYHDSVKSFKFECDPTLATPIAPLFADSSSNQWWDTKYDPFSPSTVQNIPYLKTVEMVNWRFGLTASIDNSEESWMTKLRVNEDYDYSDLDVHIVSLALASTADFIFKLLKPINFGEVFSHHGLQDIKIAGNPLTESDMVINTIKKFSSDQQISLLLSINPSKYWKKLQNLQGLWDKSIP